MCPNQLFINRTIGLVDKVAARALPATPSLPWVRLLSIVGLALMVSVIVLIGDGGDAAIFYNVDFPPSYDGADIRAPVWNYSPLAAAALQPFQIMPFQAFLGLIVAIEVAALAWMVGPLPALLLVVLQVPLLWNDLAQGNLNLAATVLVIWGIRSPWPWVPLLLTKATPGVGLVWFAVRREWRNLALALGASSLLLLVTLPWSIEWAQALIHNASVDSYIGGLPFVVRAAIGAGIVAYGARTDQPWMLPLGVAAVSHANGAGWIMAIGAVKLLTRKPLPIR